MDAVVTEVDAEDEVVKEMVNAAIPRVDAVNGPAHGMPFIVMKSLAAHPKSPPKAKARAAVVEPEPVVKDLDTLGDTMMAEASDDAGPDATVPTEEPGDPDEPGSPAWEAVDAAAARAALATLFDLKAMVQELRNREATEDAVNADDEAWENTWDLDDVCSALDCTLGILAKYAAEEQNEAGDAVLDDLAGAAEIGAEIDGTPAEDVDADSIGADDDTVSKGLTGQVADAVAALAALLPTRVTKAGRVLSAANEAQIRTAVDALTAVLSAIDNAPVADDEETPVTKTAAPVAKADAPMQAVFDQAGNLMGVVDPANIIAVSTGSAEDTSAAEPEPAPLPAETTAAAPAAPPEAAAAAPPAAAPVAKSQVPVPLAISMDDNTRQSLERLEAVIKSLKEPVTAPVVEPTEPAKPTAETLDAVAKSLAEAVSKALAPIESRLAQVESQPAPGGPLLSGAADSGAGGFMALRGQSTNALPGSAVAKALAQISDPVDREKASQELTFANLRALYAGSPSA